MSALSERNQVIGSLVIAAIITACFVRGMYMVQMPALAWIAGPMVFIFGFAVSYTCPAWFDWE